MLNGFRLTLTTATPVTTSDVTGAGTIYFTPYISGYIALYDATLGWIARESAEVSLVLSGVVSGSNYDVFAYWTGSAVALELSAAWTNDTTRSSALSTQDGVYVKNGDPTRRYVGTFRGTGTNTTEDSLLKRFVWNGPEPWRQVERQLTFISGTATWALPSSSAWRYANASAASRVEAVFGLTTFIDLKAAITMKSTSGGVAQDYITGIGLDTNTANSAQIATSPKSGPTGAATNGEMSFARYSDQVAQGWHYFAWVENNSGGGTNITAMNTDATFPGYRQGGLSGYAVM